MLEPAGMDKIKLSFIKTSYTTSHPFQGNSANMVAEKIFLKINKLKNTELALWEKQSEWTPRDLGGHLLSVYRTYPLCFK